MKIVIVPGLTLPVVEAQDVKRIRRAGGGAEVVVASLETALPEVADADVILGAVPRSLYSAARTAALGPCHCGGRG